MPPEPCKTDNGASGFSSKAANYLAPVILGMDDALVELTGALTGFTIALNNNRLIALAGLTTGIAATLSMAASEFLSQEAGVHIHKPWKSAFLCGGTYLVTIILLLAPFFIFTTPALALFFTLLIAAGIIFLFTAFVSHVRHTDFKRNFFRMLFISFSVALAAFAISWGARIWWGVNI